VELILSMFEMADEEGIARFLRERFELKSS
jgi:hypothetical protein